MQPDQALIYREIKVHVYNMHPYFHSEWAMHTT